MNIYTATSSRFFASQIQRIEQGFVSLGHKLTSYACNADLVYVNNPPFREVIIDSTIRTERTKTIFNVQDIPHHISDFDTVALKEQLWWADGITSISETTRRDLFAATEIDSRVIYQPIMPVTRTGERKHLYRALFIGRIGDQNKRTNLAVHALQILGFSGNDVVTVGNQSPWYGGTYWGVATEQALNEIYNSVDFVVMVSKNEGMGLPALEAMAAGAIPVICRDLTTREEFFPSTVFPEYLNVEPDSRSIAAFIAQFLQDNDRMTEMKERLHRHYKENWEYRLSGRGVAERIMEVYNTFK